ncbi:hypothetical protein NIES4071_16210 [Calothrix sp. NIES-4071]|nr:hypothetical protein NIES4071_16210 [Calothrix sp. NIES-4071]BAZ55955.1 hypothetical protein NIES4105_16160 [Calothrix sp. NIES-4105]
MMDMSTSLLDCTIWIKKLVLLMTLTVAASVSLSFDVPAEAQLNPRPSIFKEYPYSRVQGRKVKRGSSRKPSAKPKTKLKRSSNHRPLAKPNTFKKQGAALNNRKTPFTRVQKKSPNEPFTVEFHAPGYPKR